MSTASPTEIPSRSPSPIPTTIEETLIPWSEVKDHHLDIHTISYFIRDCIHAFGLGLDANVRRDDQAATVRGKVFDILLGYNFFPRRVWIWTLRPTL